jgi:hypothetical protein
MVIPLVTTYALAKLFDGKMIQNLGKDRLALIHCRAPSGWIFSTWKG